jgi:hypothetical protein
MKMHDGQDMDTRSLFGIEDAVRESHGLAAPDFALKHRPSLGMGKNPLDDRVHVQRELEPQALSAAFIVVIWLQETRLRLLDEMNTL